MQAEVSALKAGQANVASLQVRQDALVALSPVFLLICLGLAMAVVPVIWRKPLQKAWAWYKFSRRGVILLGFVALFMGTVWMLSLGPSNFSALASGGSRASASFEQGKALYDAHCMSCHGPTGLGDGPAAAGLNPPPANLQMHLAGNAHTDQQIFNRISNGIPNSAMPAFGTVLPEEDIWQIVHNARSLASQASP